MAIIKNAITFGSGFNITAQGPIDSRQRVQSESDLTTVWGGDAPSYQGMLVVVLDTNDLWQLVGEDASQRENWKKIGADTSEELTQVKSDISTLKSGKADKFTVGNGLVYSENKIDVVIDPAEDNALQNTETGLKVVVPEVVVPQYTIEKLTTATSGASASYQLKKGNQAVGVTIDIPKDMVVSAGEVKTVEEVDNPYKGAKVGDIYIDLTIANATLDHLYIPANKLVDEYTGSTYITVGEDRSISINYESLKTQIDTDLDITTTKSSLAAVVATVGSEESGLVKDVADLKNADISLGARITALEGVTDSVTSIDSTADSGVKLEAGTSEGSVKVTVDKAALAGAIRANLKPWTTTEVEVAETIGTDRYPAGSSLQAVLEGLDSRIASAVAGGVCSVSAGDGISVNDANPNEPIISLKIAADSALQINNSSKELDIYWTKWN